MRCGGVGLQRQHSVAEPYLLLGRVLVIMVGLVYQHAAFCCWVVGPWWGVLLPVWAHDVCPHLHSCAVRVAAG